MIDIHSHVLYGVDDGASTIEDSVAMLRIAAASGTTDLVATPHASPEYKYDAALVEERLAEIASRCGDAVRLYSGCDFHLSYENIEDAIAHPQKYTINHKSYLLVEFSDLLIFRNTIDIFARLQDAGMIPVITHPERNSLLRQRIDQIEAWVEAGARVQITGQSLFGSFGRRAQAFCQVLIERHLVHFAASDAHDSEHRPPRLDEAYEWLKKHHSEALAEALCVVNPRAAINGGALELPAVGSESTERKWYKIWK